MIDKWKHNDNNFIHFKKLRLTTYPTTVMWKRNKLFYLRQRKWLIDNKHRTKVQEITVSKFKKQV